MTNKLYLLHIPCAEKGRMKINSSNESREKPVSVCLKKKCVLFLKKQNKTGFLTNSI